MYTRLSHSPTTTATLVRRVWGAARNTGPITTAAAASATVLDITSTVRRAYQSPSGCLRAPTAKARTPRQRPSKRATLMPPASPSIPATGTTESKLEKVDIGARQAVSSSSPSVLRPAPPLPIAVEDAARPKKEQRRVLHLRHAVQEWSALRQHCRWRSAHNLPVTSNSNTSGETSTKATVTSSTSSAVHVRSTPMSLSGSAALDVHLKNTDVHMAERTILLSTLAKEAMTYPQLYALFYPHGHNNNSSSNSSSVKCDTPSSPSLLVHTMWEVRDVDALVCTEASTTELLTLLRVHAYVAQHSDECACLHNTVWDAFVQNLKRRVVQDGAAVQRRHSKSAATALAATQTSLPQVLLVLVDVHRDQLAVGVGAAAQLQIKRSSETNSATPTGKRKRGSRKQALQLLKKSDAGAAVNARVAQVLTELVVPLYEFARFNAQDSSGGTTYDAPTHGGTTEYGTASTLVMLAALSAVADDAATLLGRSAFPNQAPKVAVALDAARQSWTEWRDASRKRLFIHLEALKATAEEKNDKTVPAAATVDVFVDMLRCLRWTETVELVLCVSTLRNVEELCQRILRLCCTAGKSSSENNLFECLCTPSVAAELNRLSPDRVTYAQAFTDLCAAAAAYLQHQPDRLHTLVGKREREHHAVAAARFGLTYRQLPPRPQLRSPVVQLLYAMLCCGFSASSLLTSGLCLSLSPRDALEAVQAAGLFSLPCGTAPLPVRTHGVLVDQVVHLLLQCRKDGHRVVVSSMDDEAIHDADGGTLFSLERRLLDGAAASDVGISGSAAARVGGAFSANSNSTTSTRRRGRGGKRRSASNTKNSGFAPLGGAFAEKTTLSAGGSASAGGAVLTAAAYRKHVNYIMYVSLEAIVECILRGDLGAVEKIAHALLPLLQQEGREAALTEALEYIWTTLKQRLTHLGGNDLAAISSHLPSTAASTVSSSHFQQQTTPAMEGAMSLLSSLFLPHMTESAMKMLTSANITSTFVAVNAELHDSHKNSGGGSSNARVEPAFLATPLRSEALIEMALRLSTVAILCGMPAGTVAQLTTLHNTLLKSHGRAVEVAAAYEESSAATVSAAGGSLSTAATPADPHANTANPIGTAFAVVERLERLLSDLTRLALPWARHTQSAHVRNSGAAVQQVLGLYIASTAAVVREVTQATISAAAAAAASLMSSARDNYSGGSTNTSSAPAVRVSAEYRHYLLTVVHLLYRLSTEFPVEAEPLALRQFRVEVLDPALTAVLLTSPASSAEVNSGRMNDKGANKSESAPALQMPLTTLTEVVVVMCLPDSVQHVSQRLMRGVVAAVENHIKAREKQKRQQRHVADQNGDDNAPIADTVTGALATQLLSSAATVCLRADDALTFMLLQLLELLGPLLSLWQTMTVLERLHLTGAPLFAFPVRVLIERLVSALKDCTSEENRTTAKEHISLSQQIRMLHALSAMQRTADVAVAEQRWSPSDDVDVAALLRLLHAVPYAPLLRSLVPPPPVLHRRAYSVGECGLLVEIVASSLTAMETAEAAAAHDNDASTTTGHWTEGDKKALKVIPRSLAVEVLQAVQLPFDQHDIPQLLRGYAALTSETHLQQQVLRSFVSRTIRAAPAMTPSEIVECVEAYCAGGIFHEQLYGVLLGRAADMGRRLTLELSVRLLRCGTLAGRASVRTVCVTAVQPIFSSQVRGLLQSDPRMLVSVASTALAVLHCLRDCFPHDDIGAAVLTNVARYQHDASLSVVKAALELIEKRGSADYDVTHALARHCTEVVLPSCSAAELATVTCLLLACGLRSAALLEVVYRRLAEVIDVMSGSSLARLVQGLLSASVEVDTPAMQLICARAMALTSTANVHPDTTEEREGETGRTLARRTRSRGSAKAKSAKTLITATVAATRATPLTLHHVCVFLHLLRSAGRRNMTATIATVDALLLYAQNRVEADIAAVSTAPTRSASVPTAEDVNTYAAPSFVVSSTSPPLPPPLPVLEDVHPQEVEELLRTCIDLSSKPKMFRPLVHSLADCIAFLLQRSAMEEKELIEGAAIPHDPTSTPLRARRTAFAASDIHGGAAAALAWQNNLILLVDLCSLLIRLGEANHAVVRMLLNVLYERRGTLLQRALLAKTTKQALELAGREVHPQLYKLLVDGELL